MQTQSIKGARKSRAQGSPAMRKALPKSLRDKKPLGTVNCATLDPLAYAMAVQGDCLSPKIIDGDRIVCSPSTPLAAGMFVAIHFRDGRMSAIKRLTYLPRKPHPDDEVEMLIRVEMTNPPKPFFLPWKAIDKMHAVTGVVRKGKFISIEARKVS